MAAKTNPVGRQIPWTILAWAVAVAAALLLVVVNGAVGFLGSENNPANAIFGGVLAVAAIGSMIARFRRARMTGVMCATAAAQILVASIALAAGLGSAGWHGLYAVMLGTTLFAALWLLSAWLFLKAAGHRDAAPGDRFSA